jgi:SAM-dependent methyltransferase
VDVRVAPAESLPFADGAFDVVLAQLVINFLQDPEAGLSELRRVTAPGGVVAACVWDYPGEMTLLRAFWEAAAALDPDGASAVDERTRMPFGREGDLADLWRRGRLEHVEEGRLFVSAEYEDFEDLWAPLESGVAPAGAYTVSLDEERRAALAAEYRRRLDAPEGRFSLSARAWYAVGRT